MKRWLVVLVSPKESGNVGAAARVAKNFGAGGLRVVNPRCEVSSAEARKFTAGAAELLRGIPVYNSLPEALADREISIGLTGVSGKHHKLDCVGLVPSKMLEGRENYTRGALVFGREERGMESEELEACDFLWSLPTDPDFPSLNLAQAIGISLAAVAEAERQLGMEELGRGLAASGRALNPLAGAATRGDRPATNDELNHLRDHFRRLMLRTGWENGRRMIGSLGKIRNLLVRAGATQREVNLLHGVCKQSLDALNHPERFPKSLEDQPLPDLPDTDDENSAPEN